MLPLLLVLAASSDPLEDLVRAARMPITVEDGAWSGPGAEFLEARAAASAFFLIGEQHGNEETPSVTRALLERIRPLGYRYLAIETGPLTAATMTALGTVDALREHLDRYPHSIPFFQWRGEAKLLASSLSMGYEVWGLDQEFIASDRMHLDRLAQLAPDDAAFRLASKALEDAWTAFADIQSGHSFLTQLDDATFDALDAAFAEAGPEGQRILAELRESSVVYRLFQEGKNYESNLRRIELMKRHLREYLAEAKPDGRVVMKFGNLHMVRGYTPLNQLDLGNAAAEIGPLRGGPSFHLSVAGISREGRDYRDEVPHLALFGEPDDEEWAVYDLTQLRPHLHSAENRTTHAELARVAFGFDALMAIPRLTPAKELVE